MRAGLLFASLICAWPLRAETIVDAEFSVPTSRYAHGILGDAIEWGTLKITTTGSAGDTLGSNAVARRTVYVIDLPIDHVFEDVAPRVLDVTGDGAPEVIVVETDVTKGAALAIYTQFGKLTETPHIGTRNRWLSPIGAADLDGDGHVEIAYIDRPHLAKTLRVWRYNDQGLIEVGALKGLTNHRIGERDIGGGVRTCDGAPEMIVASADWSRLIAVTFDGTLKPRDIGPHKNRRSFAKAMTCD